MLQSKPGKTPKKYYYVRYQYGGKTYYKNQDGKRSSAAQAKKAKKPIYDTYLRGPDKGQIIIPDKTRVEKTAKPKIPSVSKFNSKNVQLSKEINRAIQKQYKIYVERKGKTYELKSKKAIANFGLFNFGLNQSFYRHLKKKTDSPFFNIEISEDVRGKKILFSLDSLELNQEALKNAPDVKQAYEEFTRESDQIFNKFFSSTNQKNQKKK